MADHSYSTLARRLAIAAVVIGLVQFLLFLLSRALRVGLSPEALTLEPYGGSAILMLLLSRTVSAAALAGVTLYCRTHGYLERYGSAGRASPFKMTLVFSVVLLLISIAAELFVVPYELPLVGALLSRLVPAADTTARIIWVPQVLHVMAFIQVTVCCLLAFAAMLALARDSRRPASARDVPYPPRSARIAATALALTIYTVLAWEHRLCWPLVSVYVNYLHPGAAWWTGLAALLWPVVPAAVAYAGVRPYLARLQLARARPARAAAAAVCASLALLVAGIVLVFAVIWTHLRLFDSETVVLLFAMFVAAVYLAALAPMCRIFCRLFYRSVMGTGAPDAGRQAATA